MKLNKFKGTGVALVTPFHKDGSLDTESLKKLVKHQLDNGTDYLVILGTTGESPVINEKERALIIDTVKTENDGKLPLVLGIGGNDTLGVTNKLTTSDLSGLDGILSVSPYYNKPNQEGIYRHYVSIADKSVLPVIVYNVPGRTGSNISVETTLRLAEHPNICATKEASGNFGQCMEILKHRPDNFLVISGDDAYTFPFLTMGMDGVISVICNAFPKAFSQMVKAALENRIEESRKLHYQLLDSMNLIFADGSPGGIKVLLNALGICGETVRQPLYGVNPQVKQKLLDCIKKVQTS
jgi:4-hydroxy-tetrahydrodipicolinate synthase